MNPLYSLHMRRKLPPRPTFVPEPVPEVVDEPTITADVEEVVVNLVPPVQLVEDLHPEDQVVEDLEFQPDPVPEEDVTQEVVVVAESPIEPTNDNDELPVVKKKLWQPSQRKAELLHIAQEIGLTVTEENTKDEIIEALRTLD